MLKHKARGSTWNNHNYIHCQWFLAASKETPMCQLIDLLGWSHISWQGGAEKVISGNFSNQNVLLSPPPLCVITHAWLHTLERADTSSPPTSDSIKSSHGLQCEGPPEGSCCVLCLRKQDRGGRGEAWQLKLLNWAIIRPDSCFFFT